METEIEKGTVQAVPAVEQQGQPTRLIITQMVLENFKSYAGERILGPFHSNFSTIVGPNGSGKSNVIDAMLFVFGFRASKMRQSKVSELIHNSQKHPTLSYCQVNVHFTEVWDLPNEATGDPFTEVPDSSFIVTRRAHKDNSSSYAVNGKKKTYGQVQDLLQSKGIDLTHNRFLILQGEVEAIAMMKPKAEDPNGSGGLLEYLEDIIGTAEMKQPIEDAAKQIDVLNEDRAEKMRKVNVIAGQKDDLEETKNAALTYFSAVNAHARQANRFFQYKQWNLQNSRANKVEKNVELEKKLAVEVEKTKALREDMEAKQVELQKLAKDAKEADKAQRAANDKFHKLSLEHTGLETELKCLKKKGKKIERDAMEGEMKMKEIEESLSHQQADLDTATAEYNKLNEQLQVESDALDSMYDELRGTTDQLQKELEAKQKDLLPFSTKSTALKQQREQLQSQVDDIRSVTESAADKMTELKGTQEELQSGIQEFDADLAQIAKELETQDAAKADLEKDLAETEALRDELVGKMRTARDSLEASKVKEQAGGARSGVVQALLEMQKRKKLSGIHGRLGDLGSIDDAYDVAVTTACGHLNSVVVETTAEAQRAVEYLKKSGAGRATFIIMQQIAGKVGQSVDKPFQAPAGSERLFDLVRPADAKYRTAFYFALRNTLVAKDLDTATAVSKGSNNTRHRVVTLMGEVIETSGTMSGGGAKPRSGGMSSAAAKAPSTDDDGQSTEELQTLCQELQGQLTLAKSELQRIKSELVDATKTTKQLTKRQASMKANRDSLAVRLQSVTEKLAEIEADSKLSTTDEGKITKLESQIADIVKQEEAMNASKKDLEAAIEQLQDDIIQVGGYKVRVQKGKVDSLKDNMELIETKMDKLKAAVKSGQHQKTKTEKSMAGTQEQLLTMKEDYVKLKEAIAELEETAVGVKQTLDEATEHVEALKLQHANLANAIEEAERELSAFQSEEFRISAEIKVLREDLEEIDEALASLAHGLDGLKLELFDGEVIGEERDTDADADDGDEDNMHVDQPGEFEGLELQTYSEDQLEAMDGERVVNAYKHSVKALEEAPIKDIGALEEYQAKEDEYLAAVGELEAVTAQRDGQRQAYENLRKDRMDMFMVGFGIIKMKLKEMYQMITLGGDAELELVDSLDPFTEGVEFAVRPPRKTWKKIRNLSGGEKTLSSLALVFALHHYKPTPLYVMDEIDAALDFKNVSIVANYIKERTKNAQFIIISLRNNMFELADRLVGIYKTEDCTKTVTVEPNLVSAA
eukprot:Clim_evm10s207 gene=Clim_evmTU10s207